MLLNRKISVLYFVREIRSQIILIVIFAAAIGMLDMLPVFRKVSLPLSIPALVGTAVSLLLAFRTAQSMWPPGGNIMRLPARTTFGPMPGVFCHCFP